jgi:hypothetical protein
MHAVDGGWMDGYMRVKKTLMECKAMRKSPKGTLEQPIKVVVVDSEKGNERPNRSSTKKRKGTQNGIFYSIGKLAMYQ